MIMSSVLRLRMVIIVVIFMRLWCAHTLAWWRPGFDSCTDFNLHHGLHIVGVVVSVDWLTVETLEALTFLGTLHVGPETLTVIFTATWFLAGTATQRHESRDTLECPRMSEIGHLSSFINRYFIFQLVTARDAFTALAADLPLGEALTVHLQTVNFGAFAALICLSWWKIHLLNYFLHLVITFRHNRNFLNELLKKIFANCLSVEHALHLIVLNQLNWSRWGRFRSVAVNHVMYMIQNALQI